MDGGPSTSFISLLNEGIAGGRLLHDSLGPSGLARFDRDVLAQTGATHVIVQMGNNDIFTINPAEEVTADQIIQGHKQLIERAHAQGLKIYGCTLNPVEGFLLPGTPSPVFSPAKEVKRQTVKCVDPSKPPIRRGDRFRSRTARPECPDENPSVVRQRRPCAPDRRRLPSTG